MERNLIVEKGIILTEEDKRMGKIGQWEKDKEQLPNEFWSVKERGQKVAVAYIYRDSKYKYDLRGFATKTILLNWVSIVTLKTSSSPIIKQFKTKKDAKKYIINWMRKHPKGR